MDEKEKIVARELSRYLDGLTAFAALLLGPDAAEAEDICQRSAGQALRNANKYDTSRPFLPYLKAICLRETQMYFRRKSRSRVVYNSEKYEKLAETLAQETPEDKLFRGEDVDAWLGDLRRCFGKEPAHVQSLLRERYGEDRPLNEIAHSRGVSKGSLAVLFFRARKALRDCVEKLHRADPGEEFARDATLFLENELDATKAERFLDRILANAELRSEYIEQVLWHGRLRSNLPPPLARTRWKVGGIAAAIALSLASISLAAYIHSSKSPTTLNSSLKKTELKSEKDLSLSETEKETNMEKNTIVSAALSIVAASAIASADVWSECKALFVPDTSKEDSFGIVNLMNGDSTSWKTKGTGSANLSLRRFDVPTQSAWTNELYSGYTETNRLCIYAAQGDAAADWCSIDTGYTHTAPAWSVLMRVRRETETTSSASSWFCHVQLRRSDGTVGDAGFGAWQNTSQVVNENGVKTGNRPRVYIASAASGGADGNFSQMTFHQQIWTDIAYIVQDKSVTVGIKDETMQHWKWQTVAYNSAASTIPASTFSLLGTNTGRVNTMRGAMRFAAFWEKALTQDEIVEAFSQRHPYLLYIGAENCGRSIFKGAENTELSLDNEWNKVPATFAKDTTITALFDVQPEENELPQFLRIKGIAGEAEIRASVDDTDLGTHRVRAGNYSQWYIPGSLLSSSTTHTLKLQTIEGSTSLDVIALGGSFRIGLEDDRTQDTAAANATYETYNTWDACLWNHKSILKPAQTNEAGQVVWNDGLAKLRIRFDVPAHLRNISKLRYTTRWYDAYNVAGSRIQLKVNGTKIYEDTIKSGSIARTVELSAPLIVEGENEIVWELPDNSAYTLRADGKPTDRWYRSDSHKIEFLEPKLGTRVILY